MSTLRAAQESHPRRRRHPLGRAGFAAILLGGVVAVLVALLSGGTGRAQARAAAKSSHPAANSSSPAGLRKIKHIVVIYLENWSFDSLYGNFPGADGLAQAANAPRQVDAQGNVYATLPQPLATAPGAQPTNPFAAENSAIANPAPARPLDPRFPANLPNAPFPLFGYVPPTGEIADPGVHFYQEQAEIDGGKMDRFVAIAKSGALPLGWYDATTDPLGRLAAKYTLADHFFHAAYGVSLLNHFWLISAATPTWPNAPASVTIKLGPGGTLLSDGAVTPDGYLVNTAYSAIGPHPAQTPSSELVPPLTNATIGDRLSAKGISWAWYSGGWNAASAGHPDPLFQFNHQPFAYFAKYAPGTPGATHLKDETALDPALANNTLPAVSFVKPDGADNEHPGYTNLADGENQAAGLIKRIMHSSAWKTTAIIVTYDENGGFWDHVPPPKLDRWGDGTRVPAIIISPFAKRHFVDHTTYDTTSILALIEKRFGLKPLSHRDATAAPLLNAFNFAHRG
jgi:phospholipase C